MKQTFLKYVSFNVFGMIGLSCYILADTFFVAQGIGADGLTALNLAIPIYSLINGMGLMLGMGGATRFSLSKSKKVFTQAVYYAGIAACVFCLLGIFYSGQIAAMLGADGDTLQNTKTYLQVILCFSPMFLLNNVVICFTRNDGNPKLAMTAMLVGSFSNIVLDYVFVFPCQMGMFGAALATGIAPVISLGILSVHFLNKKSNVKLRRSKPEKRAFLDITSLGISAFITEISSGIVIIVFNAIILKMNGNIGVAAYGIIANIALVVIAIFTGIAQGMQPLISQFYSIKDKQGVKQIVKYGMITAVSIAFLVYAVSTIFAPAIVTAFNKDNNALLAQIAVPGLRIYFTAFLFAGVNILCATYFSAIGNPKNAFLISLLRGFAIIVPTAIVLSVFWGINGVWSAMTVTEVVVLVVIIAKKTRKRISLYLLCLVSSVLFGCSAGETKKTPVSLPTQEVPAVTEEQKALPSVELVEWSDYFQGLTGAAVLWIPKEENYMIYQEELSMTQRSPCSTFKIISSLIGMELGIINPEDSQREWSGETFWKEEWNQNLDWSNAFRYSCVWYFREIMDEIGADRMQEELVKLQYGNADISDWEGHQNNNNKNPALTGFWIESSLKISPKEQTEVMERIFGEESAYQAKTITALKKVMEVLETKDTEISIYGKTGMGKTSGVVVDSWFTGFAEKESQTVYFCVYLGQNPNQEVTSAKAKEIAIQIISNYFEGR